MRIAYYSARTCVACPREAEIFAGLLAGDGTSGFKNARHHSSIEFRDITLKQRRAVHHRDACYADVVLDCDLLAAQQTLSAGMDIRLPVPGAVRIIRCRRPVSRRSRRNRRQGGRHQFVKPAVRGQRSFEGLLKGRNFASRENETEIRSKIIDLLQCRKANCHASPTYSLLKDKRKKPSAARKGPEWHQCRCHQWSRGLTLQNETSEVVTQTSSAAQELFRNARIHVRSYCVLASPTLSMRRRHLFYAGGAQMTRSAD